MYAQQNDPMFAGSELGGSEVIAPQSHGSIRIIAESAFAPQQSYRLGKLLYWCCVRGIWSGVISSSDESGRRTFRAKDILCNPEDLREGMTVAFHSKYREDLSAATQVRPYGGPPIQTQSEPSPSAAVDELCARVLEPKTPKSAVESDEYGYGQVIFWADESREGFIKAGATHYKFEAADVIRGIPSMGCSARFLAVSGDTPRARQVELA